MRTVPLKEICEIQIGPFGSLLHKEDYIVGGIPLVNPMHIVSGQIRVGKEQTVSEQKAATLNGYRLETGDVVMGRRGEMGRCAIVSDNEAGMLCGTGSLYFRPYPGELSPVFLARTLSSESMKRRLEGLSQGVTMPNLNKALIEKLRIPLPPLPEQKRIARILDAADALRAKRREALAQLDSLVQSTFLEIFGDPVTNPIGWDTVTLPDISTKLTDGPFGSNLKSAHYVDQGVRVIRLQNVGIGELLEDDLAFISHDHFSTLARNHCEPGDVIIATMGEPNLRACIIPSTLEHSLNKADCLLMRVDCSRVTNVYLCWLLNCSPMVSKALELVRGQTRGRISLGRLKELELPLPPLSLQQEFATIVESIERQKARHKEHLAELDTLFASLQSRAFNGEL